MRDRDGVLGLQEEAEPGHAVGGWLEHHPAIEGGGAVPQLERLGVQPFAQRSEPSAQRGVGLLRCPLECRGLECGGGIGVEPGDRLEDGAQLGQADRTRAQRLERGGMAAGGRRVGDQRAGGALGHHQGGRELGEERSGGELPLRRRGTGVHPFDRMRVPVRPLDQPQLLGLRRPDAAFERDDPVEVGMQRECGARVPRGWSWIHSSTTHRHSCDDGNTLLIRQYTCGERSGIHMLWRTSRRK